jgi:hypothetical protein
VPQIATVGLVGGFRDTGAIGTQEEPAAFRRNTRACSVLRRNAETLVRSEKTCVSEGESPSSLEARLPEFGTKVMNGKV